MANKPAPPGRGDPTAWRIAIYIRLSREDGEEARRQRRGTGGPVPPDASGSVVEQEKLLTQWVEERFAQQDYRVVEYFIDDGQTGTDDTRDDFRRMMEFVEDGRVNCIVVKTLSRAFRNYADQGRYLEEVFPRKGVRFISTGNPFVDSYHDPEAIRSGLEIPLSGLMNDRLAAKTSADIRRTFDAKRRRGEFIGAFAPYGYRKDPADKNRLLVDEEAARWVGDIFHWFVVEGMSKRGIALRLNRLGVPNPTAYKQQVQKSRYQNPAARGNDGRWSPGNVLAILKNRLYVGDMVQGRHRIISYKVHTQVQVPEEDWIVVPGTHQPIVDRELYRQAQQLNGRSLRTPPGRKEAYLFSGLLRCADCNKAMARKTSKERVYYHCRTALEKGPGACTKRSIREDRLVRAVWDAVRLQLDLLPDPGALLASIPQERPGSPRAHRLGVMLRQRQEELEKLIRAMDSLYLDWKGGDITGEEYRRMKASFGEQADALGESTKALGEEADALARGSGGEGDCPADFLGERTVRGLHRGLAVALIDGVYVHRDGQVTVDFAFSDTFRQAAQQQEKGPPQEQQSCRETAPKSN